MASQRGIRGAGAKESSGDYLSYGWVARNAYLFDVQYGARQGVTEFSTSPGVRKQGGRRRNK